MAKRGRPSSFDPKVAAEICDLLALDNSLASICSKEGMPTTRTVHRWRKEHEEFGRDYMCAREEQGHAAADTVGDIRRKIISGELDANIGKAAADLAKWEASKRAARDFGDKIDVTSGGDKLSPEIGETERVMRIASILNRNADPSGS